MARLALNKSSMTRQVSQLKSYKEFLPSLDLKRRQLVAEQVKARLQVTEVEKKIKQLQPMVEQHLIMLSNVDVELGELVSIKEVELSEENVVGSWLPTVKQVHMQVHEFSLLGKPHWVDRLVDLLKVALESQIEKQVAEQRLKMLDKAVKTITQRVNLFDKVLIPRTQANIKKIQIFLSDGERSAVVRSKISKTKKVVAV